MTRKNGHGYMELVEKAPNGQLAAKMRVAGIDAKSCVSLKEALALASAVAGTDPVAPTALVCGSLFLAGEALVELGAYPWPTGRFDPSERLR